MKPRETELRKKALRVSKDLFPHQINTNPKTPLGEHAKIFFFPPALRAKERIEQQNSHSIQKVLL